MVNSGIAMALKLSQDGSHTYVVAIKILQIYSYVYKSTFVYIIWYIYII